MAAPKTTESGHRLYSTLDVQRLALMKQLTDLGHAISSIAALNMPQLQRVAQTHARSLQVTKAPPAAAALAPNPESPQRILVVGAALAKRVQRPGLALALAQANSVPQRVVAVLDSLPNDDGRPTSSETHSPAVNFGAKPANRHADLLLVHVPHFLGASVVDVLKRLRALAHQWGARQVAVVYGYAPAAACQALMAQGVQMWREGSDDHAFAVWLGGLRAAVPPLSEPAPAGQPSNLAVWAATLLMAPPRRYDDATLTYLAGLSSTIACECPQHVAGLLMQLSHFEDYSAQCHNQGGSAQDLQLHAYLQRVAGAARALFEDALERVALQEGLLLPALPPQAINSAARTKLRPHRKRQT